MKRSFMARCTPPSSPPQQRILTSPPRPDGCGAWGRKVLPNATTASADRRLSGSKAPQRLAGCELRKSTCGRANTHTHTTGERTSTGHVIDATPPFESHSGRRCSRAAQAPARAAVWAPVERARGRGEAMRGRGKAKGGAEERRRRRRSEAAERWRRGGDRGGSDGVAEARSRQGLARLARQGRSEAAEKRSKGRGRGEAGPNRCEGKAEAAGPK